MTQHSSTCPCRTCDTLARRVVTTEDWLAEHRSHGAMQPEPFPHPSGDWLRLACPCGSKHITTRDRLELKPRPDRDSVHRNARTERYTGGKNP